MIKVGRYTSGLLLITVGISMILELLLGGDKLSWLLTWWPLIFILLGLEYLFYSSRYRNEDQRMKLDILGLMIVIVISVLIIGSMRAPVVMKMLQQNDIIDIVANEITGFQNKEGYTFDTLYTEVPIDSNTKQIKLHNTIGDIIVRSGEVDQLIIEATVRVNVNSEQEAQKIADQTAIQYKSGKTLEINATGPHYSHGMGVKSPPRIDLAVTVPAELQLNTFTIELVSGALDIAELSKVENFVVDVTNGKVILAELQSVQADLVNGELSASQINGNLDVEVTRGAVNIDQVNGKLDISTNLSDIHVVSDQVGGNWDIENTFGKINLRLPIEGNYSVKAEVLGVGTTEFPFKMENDLITGVVGNGKYQIQAETTGELEIFQN